MWERPIKKKRNILQGAIEGYGYSLLTEISSASQRSADVYGDANMYRDTKTTSFANTADSTSPTK